jgi:hypothetical protein
MFNTLEEMRDFLQEYLDESKKESIQIQREFIVEMVESLTEQMKPNSIKFIKEGDTL